MYDGETRTKALELTARGHSLNAVSKQLAIARSTLKVEVLEEHPAEFLRGLLHSDGCRVDNWATRTVRGEKRVYSYGRWQFVNHSPEIRQWCTQALDRLEIPWRQSSWKTVSVSRREGVARLDELVGPKC